GGGGGGARAGGKGGGRGGAGRPPRNRRSPAPSLRWPAGARWRPASRGPRGREDNGDLLELTRMVEVVQPEEQERLPPVERPEHPVLDAAIEGAVRRRAEHPREERVAIAREEGAPLRGRARRRVLGAQAAHARRRRRAGQRH